MSRQPGDEPHSPDSIRPGGFANVFRGLTTSKSAKPAPPLFATSAAVPRAEFINATPISSRGLSTNHVDAFELLKNGSPNERISAANTLRYAIAEYPLNPVLDVWYAAKDLIDPHKSASTRAAGWELLTECVKHASSTDLERREYFQTLSATANPEDFHLQLAALVDLTNGGRVLAGFDYDLLPLLTLWLRGAYNAARTARKNASQPTRGSKSAPRSRAVASGEDKNFSQLFAFLIDVIKFNFNSADEDSVNGLVDGLLTICMNTSIEDDLKACINVINAIVTFGFIPNDKLKGCIQVLSSIYCLVSSLQKQAWRTLANLCRSHNGQTTVRILLDTLRTAPIQGVTDRDLTREARAAIAVLQKLMSKGPDKGYPTVPYALLVDGLSNTLKSTSSPRVYCSILQIINSLFDDGEGQMRRVILDEDWSACLRVTTECLKRVKSDGPEKSQNNQGKEDTPADTVVREVLSLIHRLDVIFNQKSIHFIPRQTIVDFFLEVHELIPDSSARIVLEYFQEFRCCSPSDLRWEENVSLVLRGFFTNRNRSSNIRLCALQTVMDAYNIVNYVGDGAEQTFIPRLTRKVLLTARDETDILVLQAIMSLLISIVESCGMDLFEYIIDALTGMVVSDRLKSPIISPTPPTNTASSANEKTGASLDQQSSPSNIITKGCVKMFLDMMHVHSEKSVVLFNTLVSIAKPSHCETDARLTAMKLLFRLRADWANRVFLASDPEAKSLASAICRTDASLAKKQSEEAAQALRLSRSEHGGQSRSSRGVSLGQGQTFERGLPARTPSGTKSLRSNKYQQLWKYPDPDPLFESLPTSISPILLSRIPEPGALGENMVVPERPDLQNRALKMTAWLEAVLHIMQASDWEIYSFVLVHLPSQLSNHAIFRDAIPAVQELRRVVCEQIRTNGFQEPPNATGLRRADVAICLFHNLTMILSYHEHFHKSDEDEIVKSFVLGITTWERSAKYCIHALSICCHELPLSTSKSLVQMLNQMAAIITQPHVSIHILEFLACLSRLHSVFVNFREDEFRIVFAICFRYLEYAREKRQSNRNSHTSEPSTPATPSTGASPTPTEATPLNFSDDVPQYVHALAYHVILFWFLALKLPDRANHVGWIVKKLFADIDGTGQKADEQALTSIDFMQRVTYADVDESAEDPYFTEDRFGDIGKKRWIVGNSIVTVKQATVNGWAQIVKRQPSGTSAYTVRETYTPPPPHQTENYVDVSREGQLTTNSILPSHLMVQLMSPVPQTFDSARPIPLPEDEATERAIRVFDRSSSLDGHKVGVVYIGEGQSTEAEILSNVTGSSDYTEFLNNLGTLTKLKGATFNTQGLDRENDRDGAYTFCWRDRVTEIMFHVTTQMPTNPERDPQCILKKSHIGNDFVNIIFNEAGTPFKFDTFPSQFNFVNIVITPASSASFIGAREADSNGSHKQPFYKVQVMSKPGFPEISPAAETKMVSLKALPGFIRLLALNASMFSAVWYSREYGEHISSWSGRLRDIKRLRERHGPKASHTTSASPTSVGGAAQTHQGETSRPGSSVRDSFTSLRRTSVATFFTTTSDQTSQRSSTMSTSAGIHDGETGAAPGLDTLVESADFSKWG